MSANHGSWSPPPPAVELILSVNTMQKGFRPGFNQVTETIYWKSWVLKDVSNRITSFAVPRTCKNSSKTVSKARLSSQMHRSRQTIFHGLKKVKKSHAGVHWHMRHNPGLALVSKILNLGARNQNWPYTREVCANWEVHESKTSGLAVKSKVRTETCAGLNLKEYQWAGSHEVFEIMANWNLSEKFKGPTLGPHHIVLGTVADKGPTLGPHHIV